MKRQLTSIMLFSALLVGGASTFVSCTDHESDSAYNTSVSLADAIAKQKTELTALNNELKTDLEGKLANKADKSVTDALYSRITENERKLANLDIPDVSDFVKSAQLDAAIQGSKTYAKEYADGIKTDINNYIAEIEALRQTDKEAAERITDALDERLTTLNTTVTNFKEAQEKFNEAYNEAFDYLVNKKLDGITINATENPVLGYYNASFIGSQLNLAASFYGTATQAAQDWDIAKGDFLNTGDAGKIYVTLNPTEIDPQVVKLKLVDSQGNEAKGFELDDIKNTDKVLTFGVTKASGATVAANGFYAVPVKATDPANDDFSLDKGELKEAAKNILEKLQHPSQTNLQVSQIATTLYRSINNKLKAYGVQAEYYMYDPAMPEGKRMVKKHAMTQYNTAAFAVKPLSYNFLKDNEKLNNLDLPSFPTLQSKINFNDYKFNWTPIEGLTDIETSVTLKGMPDINTIKVNGTVPAPTVDASAMIVGTETVKGTVTDDGKVIFDWGNLGAKANVTIGDINVSGLGVTYDKTDQTYDITIPMADFNRIIDDINRQVGNMIGNVNGIVDKVNGYVETIDGKYIAGINNLITKFENVLKKSNALLQPAMFYLTSDNNWNQLARVAEGASYLKLEGGKASTVFVATSYTAEMLAPAYKKCISVTDKPSGATVTGVNLDKVVNGDVQKIGFEADKEGVYELTYKAVDYSGVEASKKFYVKVVK